MDFTSYPGWAALGRDGSRGCTATSSAGGAEVMTVHPPPGPAATA